MFFKIIMSNKEELEYRLNENKTGLIVGSALALFGVAVLSTGILTNYFNNTLIEALPGLLSLGIPAMLLTIGQLFSDIKERKKIKNELKK